MKLLFPVFAKQELALNYLWDLNVNEVLYGGAARGGKSFLGCGWVILSCFKFPGSSWLVAREELTKIKDTTLITFRNVLRQMNLEEGYHYKFNASTLTFEFYPQGEASRKGNGEVSRVFFREISFDPRDPEFDRMGSYDLTGAFIDEAQQIHPKAINVLRGRFSVIEKKKPNGQQWWRTVPKMLYTCNPAKNWIYTDFIRPDKEGTLRSDRVVIRSLATDNPYVTADYIENLKKSDKTTVERLLYGNFEYDDAPNALLRIDDIDDMWLNPVISRPVKYMTVDVARFGSDASVQFFWNDWELYKVKVHHGIDTARLAEIISQDCKEHRIARAGVIIDESGVGGGVIDQVRGVRGFIGNAKAIENERAYREDTKKENFRNLRSQCIYKTAQKIKDHAVSIMETDLMFKDMLRQEVEQWKTIIDNVEDDNSKIQVISKDEMKIALGRSPDYADALMMRYYFELKREYQQFITPDQERDQIQQEEEWDPFAVI